MKRTSTLFQQYIAYALLIAFFLQSCGSLNVPLIPMGEEDPHIQTYTQQQLGSPIQTLTAEGEHLVTFYEYKDELLASVEPLDEKDKIHNDLSVVIEEGTDIASLPHLSKKIQENCIVNLGEHNKELDIQAISDQELVTEGGHLVTFYKEEDKLKASIQVNPLDEADKFYSGVDVLIEKGAALAILPNLDKKTQQRRIQVQFAKGGKPQNVVIHKPWIMGGGFSEVIMFCGNPGVGKSTLCNSIFQRPIFASGISGGRGMTTNHQAHSHDNKLYIDTPGLNDIEMRERAAEEIEKALKHNNNYKIVFVAMLDQGRIRADDLTTINTVCNAISKDVTFEYGIIFNQVSKKVAQKIEKPVLDAYLTTLHKKPALTIILTREEELDGETNTYFSSKNENREKLLDFINTLKANKIEDNQINKLDVRDFEEKVREIEEKFRKEVAEQLEQIKKLTEDIIEATKREQERERIREQEIEEACRQLKELKQEKERIQEQERIREQERRRLEQEIEETRRQVRKLKEKQEKDKGSNMDGIVGTAIGVFGYLLTRKPSSGPTSRD